MNTDSKEAVLLKKIEVSSAGFGCQMRMGDLSGDGRLDFVLIQPDNGFDERYFPHSVAAATAYSADGDILWQIGKPTYEQSECNTDLPAQIYDIDRDGFNEFLCVTDGVFCVFDGKTGELKRKNPLPDPYACDCFAIADLEGTGYPQNIIIKNRYHQLWAMDLNFNVIWTYKGNIGHYPIVCDINADGREEIIAGNVVLDADGNVLWEFDGYDFPKSICVADLNMSGEWSIVAGGNRTRVFKTDGEEKWSLETRAVTSEIAVGNIRPETFGFEITGFYREKDENGNENNGIFLTDYHGNTLFKEKRTEEVQRDHISAIHNFDGKGSEHIVLTSDENCIYVYDGYMNPVYYIPDNGKIFTADILSDNMSQILVYNGQNVCIYSSVEKELTKPAVASPRPQSRSLYNYTLFPYTVVDSARNAVGYAVGQFSDPDIKAWAKWCAAEGEEEAMSRADFCIVLTEALGMGGYSTETFFDVSRNDYFYLAVSAIKERGYIDDIVGKFAPSAPVSAEFALSMVEKAAGFIPLTTKRGEDELTKKDVAKLILQIYQNREEI